MSLEFRGQALNKELVALVAEVLDGAGVPSLLWGNFLLSLYGVPTVVDGVSFVVPDHLFDVAFRALQTARFPPCEEFDECRTRNVFQAFPPSSKHLHIAQDLLLTLRKTSEIFIGKEDVWDEQNTDKILMYASDPRLPPSKIGGGSGPYPLNLHKVRIPNPVLYTETVIRLALRDHPSHHASLWLAMITYIITYVDDGGLFRADLLTPRCREIYVAIKQGIPGWRKIFHAPDESPTSKTSTTIRPTNESVSSDNHDLLRVETVGL